MSLGRTFKIGVHNMPAVGLGTWQSPKGEVRAAVCSAINAGYRHVDAAWVYRNQREVGDGIKDSKIKREDLWLTSKVWNTFHDPAQVEVCLDDCLKDLQTSYLDMLLMHWPVAQKKAADGTITLDKELSVDFLPTWRAMEALVETGKVRYIGISNFTIGRAQKLLDKAIIKPVVNQVELNLRCAQPELLAWAKKNNVLLQAYSPLGSTGAPQMQDPVVLEIAKAHGVEGANVLIAWQVQRGVCCLPKSVTPSRIASNFKDVVLTDAEVEKMEKRAASQPELRTVDPSEAWGLKIFEEIQGGKL